MDPGQPSNLERLFAQYDRIRSHRPSPTAPPPETPPETPPEAPPEPDDIPPSMEPPDDDYDQPMDVPEKSWGDIQAEGMAEAQRLINEPLRSAASFKEDEDGLEKAYGDTTTRGTFYDSDNRTLYVKGTQTGRDVWDDVSKIPFGRVQDSQRYKEADTAYHQIQDSGQPVDRIVGHSLGGSVALEMQKQYGIPRSRTFGAPVVDFSGRGSERYGHPLDPVSMFDGGARTSRSLKLNPHDFHGWSILTA